MHQTNRDSGRIVELTLHFVDVTIETNKEKYLLTWTSPDASPVTASLSFGAAETQSCLSSTYSNGVRWRA